MRTGESQGKIGRLGLLGWLLVAGCALWLVVVAAGCSSQGQDSRDILVFAAASLADVMNQVVDSFERQHGTTVTVSYDGSQALAQQISRGAPADVFISAGAFPMDFLEERGLVSAESTNILTNKLVVVVESDSLEGWASVEQLASPQVERIAIATPELAPAGRYARESLQSLGLWDGLQSKLVFGSDVRVTLAYLEGGNVDAVLVYETDARVADNVTVLDIVPPDSYSRIVYPAAVVLNGDNLEQAQTFLKFLTGEKADEIFRSHGFAPSE